MWLELAPKEYKTLYEAASDDVKATIEARAEYFDFRNQYMVENFWQLSGIKAIKVTPLNENVIAPKGSDDAAVIDPMIEEVKNKMLSYN